MLAAMMLAILSNLFGGISHYGAGPAPLYFGAGYSSLRTWWGVGGLISIVNLTIWFTVGLAWWKLIGIW